MIGSAASKEYRVYNIVYSPLRECIIYILELMLAQNVRITEEQTHLFTCCLTCITVQ